MRDDAPWHVRVLGPVAMVRRDEVVMTRSPMLRTLVALLTVEPGRPAGTTMLIDELWGAALPQDPRAALQIQVTRLRAWLSEVGAPRETVRFEHGGYLVDVARDRVDAVTFAGRVDAVSKALAHDPAEALLLCDAALAAWHGEPFGGCVAGLALESEKLRLTELHLRLRELRCDAFAALGDHDTAIAELQALTAAEPARERPVVALMSALARAGRRREALAVAHTTRRYLADRCGLEPSRRLEELERRILDQSDELAMAAAPDRLTTVPVAPGYRPLVVGRDVELATVIALGGNGNQPELLVVHGEAGSGKTTLVEVASHDLTAAAAGHGAGAHVGIGTWTGDQAPFGAWIEALEGLGVELAIYDRVRSRALADVVRAALGNAAVAGPVLLVLEDAHLADDPSLALLQTVAARPLPARVAIVVTAREPPLAPAPGWLRTRAELQRTGRAAEMRLAELGHRHVLELAERRLRGLPTAERRRVGEKLWERSRGHPLHLAALLDTIARVTDGTDGTACLDVVERIPDQLAPLVRYQLEALDATARDAVEALALVEGATLPELAAVVELTAGDTRRAVHQAAEIGLVTQRQGDLRLRHPLTRQIVVEGLPVASRKQLHMAWLDRSTARTDAFEALAHARGADDLLTPARRGRIELAAGRVAYRRGAYGLAATILAAAEEHLGPDDLGPARLQRGLALSALGRGDEADELLDAVVGDPGSPLADVVTAAVGDDVLGPDVRGDPKRLTRLRQAEVLTAGTASRDRVRVLSALVREEQLVHGTVQTDWAIPAIDELANGLDDDEGRAIVAQARAHELTEAPVDVATRLAAAEEAYRLTEQRGDPWAALDATELLLSASLAAGDVERCLELRWVLAREAERANRPRSIWAAHLVDAALALASGQADVAETKAAEALDVGTRLGIADALGAYGVHVLVKSWLAGRLGDALPVIEQARASYPKVAAWQAAEAAARLAAGDTRSAAACLTSYVEQRRAATYNPFDRPGLCFAAEAACVLGDGRAGEEVLGALPPDPHGVVVVGVGAAVLGPVDLHVARAQLATGRSSEARTRLASAATLVDDLGWRPWRAICATTSHAINPGSA